MPINHQHWNKLVDGLARNRILGVNYINSKRFIHPWRSTVYWASSLDSWACQMFPGYVNSEEVVCDSPRKLAASETLKRLDENRAGEDFLSAWISEGSPILIKSAVPRGIGFGSATSSEPVPSFFLRRGVLNSPEIKVDIKGLSLEKIVDADFLKRAKNKRLLRACELALRIPQPTVRTQIDLISGKVPAFTFAFSEAKGAPSLGVVREFSEWPPVSLEDLVSGGWESPDRYNVHIATVYFLSPAGMSDDALPDESWTPYVKHHCFWNLGFDYRIPINATYSDPIVAPGKTLAGGAAAGVIQGLEDDINYWSAQADALLANATIKAKHWSL